MTLLKLTLKNIAAKKTLYLGTALSVVVAVAFVVGVFVVTGSLRTAFGDIADRIAGQVDLRVRAEVKFGDRIAAPVVDPELASVVAAVDGVAATDGSVAAFNNVVIIDADGQPLETRGPPQLGLSWSTEPSLAELYLVDGRRPTNSAEFTVDVDTVENFGLVVGETYRVSLPTGTRSFELVGTMNWGDPEVNQAQGAQFAAFDLATATELLNDGDGWTLINVDVARDADIATVAAAITAVLPDGVEVVTVEQVADEQTEQFDLFVNIFQNILLAFAIVTVVVSAFLVNNVFAILVGQRVREFGLMRALGATSAQVSRLVLGESALLGLLASGLGILGGMGVAAALDAIFRAGGGELPIDPLAVSGAAVGAAFAVGAAVTVLAALAPALKARRMSPLAALRDDAPVGDAVVRRRIPLGIAGLVVGAALLGLGLRAGSWQLLIVLVVPATATASWGGRRIVRWGGRVAVLAVGAALLITAVAADLDTIHLLVTMALGALTVFIGINMTSAMVAKPLSRALGAPLALADGVTGNLARQNTARNPRRTSATAAALMVGLALVVTVGVAADSLKSTFASDIDRQFNADWILCSRNCADRVGGFSPQLAMDLKGLPEFSSVAAYGVEFNALRTRDGETHTLASADVDDLSAHLDLDVVAGSADNLRLHELLLHTDTAETYGVGVGEVLSVEPLADERVEMTVAGIFADSGTIVGSWVVSPQTWDLHFKSDRTRYVTIVTAPGVSEAEAAAAIESKVASHPQVNVYSKDDFVSTRVEQIEQGLLIVNVLLGVSLVIAVLGIVATLALSVLERIRELGLLRAVGMTRAQMRRMVCWEGLIVAVFGGLFGVGLGILFGMLATDVVPDAVINTLTFPVGQIVLYLVLAAIAGLLSGIVPAWWAGRLKVLESIAHT